MTTAGAVSRHEEMIPAARDGATVHSVRVTRRALTAELRRTRYWRRLLRGRLDLAVAATQPPAALGDDVFGVLPAALADLLPESAELRAAVRVGEAAQEVAMLSGLRAMDQAVARYEDALVAALEATTDQLIDQLAGQPAACLEILDEDR